MLPLSRAGREGLIGKNATPVAQSRNAVAERFGITEAQVRRIEREGLDNAWPPLDQEQP